MASELSSKNQNSSYRGKLQRLFDQGKGNLVRIAKCLLFFQVSVFRQQVAKRTNVA